MDQIVYIVAEHAMSGCYYASLKREEAEEWIKTKGQSIRVNLQVFPEVYDLEQETEEMFRKISGFYKFLIAELAIDKFSIEEIKNYITSQDSFGDVSYNLNAENIRKANENSD